MQIDLDRLTIVNYPDPVLRTRAKDVDPADPILREVAHRMIALMREADGIGLAAPQVGLSWRMFVCDVPPDPDADDHSTGSTGTQVYLNPTITEPAGDLIPLDEGCLSLPGVTGEVRRPAEITINARDLDGGEVTVRAAGMFSRCLQHEVDHLEGVLIIDKMPRMVRLKNRSAVRALKKEFAERSP